MPMASPSRSGSTLSARPWNHDMTPSISVGFRPASSIALRLASAARVMDDTPELRLKAVHPIPTIAVLSFGSMWSPSQRSPVRMGGQPLYPRLAALAGAVAVPGGDAGGHGG